MCFAIPFQVFLAIFEFYAVLLEEGIGFQPGLDLQQLAKLGAVILRSRYALRTNASNALWIHLDRARKEPRRVRQEGEP